MQLSTLKGFKAAFSCSWSRELVPVHVRVAPAVVVLPSRRQRQVRGMLDEEQAMMGLMGLWQRLVHMYKSGLQRTN